MMFKNVQIVIFSNKWFSYIDMVGFPDHNAVPITVDVPGY